MFARLRLAWRALFGPAVKPPAVLVDACARCAELEAERNYWRSREERVAEALLMREAGVAGTALPLQKTRHNPVGAAVAALGMASYDPRLKPAPHQSPREGASRATR